ncbi:MAG: glycosyltransferase family 39 protein [Saprospiraceae bacterium]
MFIDVMEIDAAQYALISMEMSFTKSFLHVYQQGSDYLDKPPLLFWLSSLSFIILGISNFAYKLPSIIIAIVGIYSLYRFALLWYSKEKAVLAALILASCQALFLMTNDIRTDTNLLGLVMFTIWQLSEYLTKSKWKHLVLAAIGLGCAMMAKGPIALIIPAAAFGTDIFLKRNWKDIFRPEWIVLLIIVGIMLVPMSYGLYTQFDLHPEKYVYGLQGPSGLRFFYWTQSFGRITGENYWQNGKSHFYFLHTILWDFQPWILVFIPALVMKFRSLFKMRFRVDKSEEFISFGGFVLVFIALSFSKYKLPHYIFVLLPFASIITANFIYTLPKIGQTLFSKIQFSISHLFWIVIVVNFIFFFPPNNAILPIFLAMLYIAYWFAFLDLKEKVERIFIPTVITAIGFNLVLASNFYPNLLKYQSSSQAGKIVSENNIPNDMFYSYNTSSFSLDFYAKRITPKTSLDSMQYIKPKSLIYVDEDGLIELQENQVSIKVKEKLPSYKVTAIKLPFLNKQTRSQKLKYSYLIEKQ